MESSQPLYQIFLIATPIGNLKDISQRAIEVLQSVDYIACEDTRKTGKLLKLYKISKPMLSFFEHNEDRVISRIQNIIEEGKSLAVVTSAGTPGISDPGYTLVQFAIKNNIPITMIPGPSALIMAIVLSGLPTHSFTFRGFAPRRSNKRQKFFDSDRLNPYTLIYYESPHRLIGFLQDALDVFGDRQAAVVNDLTKYFESVERGSLSELLDIFKEMKLLGEYVVVIDGFQQ